MNSVMIKKLWITISIFNYEKKVDYLYYKNLVIY